MTINNNIWLIGAGPMAIEYAKVLNALNVPFITIGRGEVSAEKFEKTTNCKVIRGGLEKWLSTNPEKPAHAIVSVAVEHLYSTTLLLISYNVLSILLEKPGGVDGSEISKLTKLSNEKKARICLGYNRRQYASVLEAQKIIQQDGGIGSFFFEFTEWSHTIEKISKGQGVKPHWFLANSTHVVDLAFYLCGKPKKMETFTSGGLLWHPTASVFTGAGITEKDIPFSYIANWTSGGRWGLEIMTHKRRLILKPLEKLQIQEIGSVEYSFKKIEDSLDKTFKPGLYRQVKTFLNNENKRLCSIEEQNKMLQYYNTIANYQ